MTTDRELLGPELDHPPVTHAVLVYALKLYLKHFRLFASLVVLPSLVGTFFMWAAANRIDYLTRDIPRTIEGIRTIQHSNIVWEATALKHAGFFGMWLCWAFAFSAVTVAVNALSKGRSVDPEECFNHAREEPGRFLAVAGYLYAKIIIVGFLIFFALFIGVYQFIQKFLQPTASIAGYLMGLFVALLVAVIVLPFVLAIPVATFERLGIRESLKRSFKLTEGKSLVMLGLFIEAELSSYLLSLALRWFIFRGFNGAGIPGLYSSVFYLEIAGAALVQPIAMIGYALVYNFRFPANQHEHSTADSQAPDALYS
ncbi:MAG: hypothetical protein JWO13_890 [Acidobacteriales bacterium]|nr:hypothetical protein [Terriglobales bacterium]